MTVLFAEFCSCGTQVGDAIVYYYMEIISENRGKKNCNLAQSDEITLHLKEKQLGSISMHAFTVLTARFMAGKLGNSATWWKFCHLEGKT